MIRDAHFPSGNRETGNQGPGNFPREMGDREKSENREKIALFWGETGSKNLKFELQNATKFCLWWSME